jgi:hypothetical protein
VEGAEHLAAADLDRADLGHTVVGRRPPCRLEVEDHELDVDQGSAKVVEALLDGGGHGNLPEVGAWKLGRR